MAVALMKRENPTIANNAKAIMPSKSDEAVAFCPRCKTLETLYFLRGHLIPTRKFSQNDGHIYHDCGSYTPCRLYRTF